MVNDTGLVLPKAHNWHLRGTLLAIGILSIVFGICTIIGFSYAFYDDLSSYYKVGSSFRSGGQTDYTQTMLGLAIDGSFLGMCDFTIWPPTTSTPASTHRARGQTKAPPGPQPQPQPQPQPAPPPQGREARRRHRRQQDANQKPADQQDANQKPADQQSADQKPADQQSAGQQPGDQTEDEGANTPPTTEAYAMLVDQKSCQRAVEKEIHWQHAELLEDARTMYYRVNEPFYAVLVGLDVVVVIFGLFGCVVGYLLVVGAVWKRKKYLYPWLLLSFLIAYGSVFYGVLHEAMKNRFESVDETSTGVVAAIAVIVVVLHALAFYAVAKYYTYLWRPEGQPQYPIRRMKLVLTRT